MKNSSRISTILNCYFVFELVPESNPMKPQVLQSRLDQLGLDDLEMEEALERFKLDPADELSDMERYQSIVDLSCRILLSDVFFVFKCYLKI